MITIDAPSAAIAIAPPPSGRDVNYVFVVVVTSVIYDFLNNLDNELDYLLNSRTTWAKALFLACRYIPFVICALHVPMAFRWSAEACPGLALGTILSCVILMLCAEYIFVLRTYALWNCDRRVQTVLLIVFLALFCGVIVLVVACGMTTKSNHFTPGCYSSPISPKFILAPYILLLLLEIEVVCLTLYRMIRYYYATRCRLLILVTQYSIGYILAGLFFTVINIIAIGFLPGDYGPVLEAVQVIVQALLATRMQLDLWKVDRHQVAPASESTEYGLTNVELFDSPQRATTSSAPIDTV